MKQSRLNAAFICGILALGVIVWGVGKLFLTAPGSHSGTANSGWSLRAQTPENPAEATAPLTVIYPPSMEISRPDSNFTIEPTGYSIELGQNSGENSETQEEFAEYGENFENAKNTENIELLVRGQQRSSGVALVPNTQATRVPAPNPLRGANNTNNPATRAAPLSSAPFRQVTHSGESFENEFSASPALGLTENGNTANTGNHTQVGGFAPDDLPSFNGYADELPPAPDFQQPDFQQPYNQGNNFQQPEFTLPSENLDNYENIAAEQPHVRPAPRPIPGGGENNFTPPAINVEYDPENEIEPLGSPSLSGASPFDRNGNSRVVGGNAPGRSIRIEVEDEEERFIPQNPDSRIPRIASSSQPGFTSPEAANRPQVRQIEQNSMTGTGTPGAEKLEGPQMPQLIVEKIGPKEVTVDQQAVFKTTVRNTGKVSAKSVRIFDKIPLGAKLSETIPKVEPGREGELAWDIGTLDPQQEVTVEMRLVPFQEGEIGSVATVLFSMDSSAKTVVTRPVLKLDVKAPDKVTIGDQVTFEITISNPGSGPATGVVLQELVPEGLIHEKGKELLNKVGTIKPKESKRFALTMQATKSGAITNYLCVKGDNNLVAEDRSVVNVLAPQIALKIEGTKQRYLERRAVYRLSVSNPGSAPANDVSLSLALPEGMKFESTDQSGVYDPQTHKVHWALETLPVQDTGVIELVAIPVKSGDYKLKFVAEGDNLVSEASHDVNIDGLAATSFAVTCLSDPVEIGKETLYEVRVTNRGTKTANNIVLAMQLSEGMTFLNAEGPVTYRSKDSIVEFDSLGSLEAKKERIYKVSARCDAPGDHRIRVQIVSDDLKEPVTKEESTKVFADR